MTTLFLNHSLVRLRIIGATIAIIGLSQASLWAQNLTSSFSVPAAAYRADRILVMPKAGKAPALANVHAQQRVAVLGEFPSIGSLQTLHVPAGETVPTLIAKYQSSGLVEYAEPDFYRALDLLPNDPQFTNGTSWALNNLGQGGGVVDADIDAPEAWDVLNSASNIVVAIIDSGIWRTHEDLRSNIWVHPNGTGYGWNALLDNESPSDGDGHGTLMAGVIGAVGNNGKGSAGVAWQVRLMACKSFNSLASGGFDSDIIEGLEFARTNGARIINMSLSGTSFSFSLSNAIFSAREAGIVVVTSAGNDAANLDFQLRFPACYDLDNIIAVAATTRTDALWSSSGFGSTNVDLAAPGQQITSSFAFGDSQYITLPGGTSFSAAYVSGASALVRAKYPAESHQQIIARILNGVDPLPSLAGKCVTGGRLNLRKALSPPIQLTLLSTAGNLPLQLRVNAGPNRNCVLEVTTNLTSWSPLFTNTTSAAGTFDFTDNAPTNSPRRFFRAVSTL
ncbi:MAG: S8 family serine peptidase [Akkermansiaceae bacterium]|nr:S8 family serine peptidase [Verrucomicrobiales bacterium]